MKGNATKIIALLLVFCMLLSLAACAKTESDDKTSKNNGVSVLHRTDDNVTYDEDDIPIADNTEKNEGISNIVDDEKKAEDKKPGVAGNTTLGNTFGTQSSTAVNTNTNINVNTNNKQESVTPDEKPSSTPAPTGDYNEGTVLVKVADSFDSDMLGELDYESCEALYKGSKWYSVKLADNTKSVAAVSYLTELGTFAKVDYDYIMGTTDKPEDNPNYKDQVNLGLSNIPNGWTHNGKAPGGSPDVIVAVIDTGVDYTHMDLRNNIWVNTAEIPDNGKDDDGNGYIDDVYGWNCVGDNNNAMDDNGHGTHVAGIIAAENNKQGGIGVAYNCKVMVLKAGNSSGYFTNSDIAEAIQYAYMNGASVINMSFGGEFISIAVEEALENAYNSCVLVAAAGNDSACNDLSCKICDIKKVFYPAALPYVIGVMSTDKNGSGISSFSNYDHSPYDSIEYEVFAVGEGVGSTWPANKYTCLNGTSMAAPTVSGIAALLRSKYSDREVYSTKFIQSQIVNTGSVNPYNNLLKEIDIAHSVADIQEALTQLPKPKVNLYEYYIDDNTSISSANNGNGIIDAGEIVRLYFSLHNRGGVASDVNVSVDTDRGVGVVDPYFTFVNPSMQLSDIGTYSVRESGEKYFEIEVSSDCPNNYLVDFIIRLTYTNGLDKNDKTIYTDDEKQKAQFRVSNGIHLPVVIEGNYTLESSRLYIVSHDVLIKENATVVVEPGAAIVFSSDEYISINVKGTLLCDGTSEKMINIDYANIYCDNGTAAFSYTKFNNCGNIIYAQSFDHCICSNSGENEFSFAVNIVTNSKFINCYPRAEYAEHCQIIDGNLWIDYCEYNEINKKNLVYLNSEECSVGHLMRQALTVDSIEKIIQYEGKTYVMLKCTSERYSNSSIEGIEYEATALASLFGAKIATLSSTTRARLGMTFGQCYILDNGGDFTWDPYKNSGNIIFESDLNFSEDDIWEAYSKYCETVIGFPGIENTAVLGPNITINNYYYIQSLEGKYKTDFSDIYWGTSSKSDIEKMINYYDTYREYCDIIPSGFLTSPTEDMWPMVSNAYILNQDGETVNVIGNQTVKFVVEFNRDMDTTIPLNVTFGTIAPYADYKVNGEWENSRQWIGEYTLKSSIENGKQHIMISNAQAAEDAFFTAEDKTGRFTFTVDTTAALSMNLQAVAKETGIELTFVQDDYDTLLGYNIYRADSKDGNYVKLNPAILLPTDSTFLDENAEPGKTYWYTYTVVLTDFSESSPAGKVMATAMDTMAPSLYHTPVNQGYENNNLVISATASDNIGIQSVTLFYRAVGAAEWKSLVMSKHNDKFNATIFGSDVTLSGIEYYIVATDGINTVQKGNAETPYTVVIKSADSLLGKGDVDGNGNVTTKDALMLMQCLNGDLLLSDDAFKRADLNGDGQLSSAEALRILQYVNGKITTLDM